MSIKKQKVLLKSYVGPAISWIKKKKENCVSFSTNNDMDRELFKWGFLAQITKRSLVIV